MDRLVLLGAAKNAAALLADADMADPVADTDVMSARSYLDMILPILSESGTDASVIALSELGRADEARSCSEEASAGMLATLDGACAGDFRDEVERRLTYEYPFAGALSVKSKYSVSELNRETSVARYFIEGSAEESLEDEGALNAAERGIALHKAFEKLDYAEAFARRRDPGYFKNFLDDLVQRRFLTAEQRDAASEEALRRYAETEIFARAAASRNLRKETPFNLKWERYGEPVIVQGVIDCFFEEDGKIVVIDFKSGRFDPARAGEESRLAARYGAQINIYREALESVLDVPADEAYLYLVNVGKTIAIQRVETRSKA
jgi:ATP-dependent helicase/nuclease subunit A